ncbi:PPC domain-containing protein [Aurantiacibacter gilvus]|uniref:PPC domain-containing protein n=1 Tax=Aurantiacibacter gilvus TaxID=3139141 RepID=A0ABU9IE97_9SPHN
MLKSIRYSMLLASASALLATPALAQVRDLDNEASDVRVFQGRVAGEPAVFYVTTPAEGSLVIDVLASGDLDPVVRVRDADSGETIAEDDDGGEGLNSRVTISGEASRRIVIEVDSYSADWAENGDEYGGSFDLRLSISNCTSSGGMAITYGASERGSICGSENLYTFMGEAGQMVEIAMIAEGDDLDPYLELRDAAGETIASNDDGGDSLNSLLRHTFEESGTYTIVATSYGDTTGDYRLRVRSQRAATAQLPLQMIGIDDEASGELVSGWAGDDSLGLTHIDYQLNDAARAAIASGNGEITIRMTSAGGGDADFGGSIDPYVEIGYDTPLGFAVIDADDDGAGDLNSLLPIDLGPIADNPGLLDMLRIRAQGFGGSAGAYTLTITEGMEPRASDSWGIE